jgi:hypothetical protein
VADNRLALHERLKALLPECGNRVYFQAPTNVTLVYPCVVYTRRDGVTLHADNIPWQFFQSYDVTIMSKNPADGLVDRIGSQLEGNRFDRHFVTDNIHHDIFVVNYPKE